MTVGGVTCVRYLEVGGVHSSEVGNAWSACGCRQGARTLSISGRLSARQSVHYRTFHCICTRTCTCAATALCSTSVVLVSTARIINIPGVGLSTLLMQIIPDHYQPTRKRNVRISGVQGWGFCCLIYVYTSTFWVTTHTWEPFADYGKLWFLQMYTTQQCTCALYVCTCTTNYTCIDDQASYFGGVPQHTTSQK